MYELHVYGFSETVHSPALSIQDPCPSVLFGPVSPPVISKNLPGGQRLQLLLQL